MILMLLPKSTAVVHEAEIVFFYTFFNLFSTKDAKIFLTALIPLEMVCALHQHVRVEWPIDYIINGTRTSTTTRRNVYTTGTEIDHENFSFYIFYRKGGSIQQ